MVIFSCNSGTENNLWSEMRGSSEFDRFWISEIRRGMVRASPVSKYFSKEGLDVSISIQYSLSMYRLYSIIRWIFKNNKLKSELGFYWGSFRNSLLIPSLKNIKHLLLLDALQLHMERWPVPQLLLIIQNTTRMVIRITDSPLLEKLFKSM